MKPKDSKLDVLFRVIERAPDHSGTPGHNIRGPSRDQSITFKLRVDTLAFINSVGETVHQEWRYLDHPLIQFPTSRSVRLKVVYEMDRDEEDTRDHILNLLLAEGSLMWSYAVTAQPCGDALNTASEECLLYVLRFPIPAPIGIPNLGVCVLRILSCIF